MELAGSATESNLAAAFAAESQARNAYMYFAETAQNEGLGVIADVFLEVGENEAEHARAQFRYLGRVRDVRANLDVALHGEQHEFRVVYPQFARTAREEGFVEIADFFERTAAVEGRHEQIFRRLLERLEAETLPTERTVGHSAIALTQIMLPAQANPAGYVHGGELMKVMDNAAGVVAARHAHSNVVTARVEDISFLRPVRVGELVMVHAQLTFVSRSSMEVRVRVETEDLLTEQRREALTAYFVMVALDISGHPAEVPPLIITTEEGQKLFEEGRVRHESRRKG